MPESQSTQEFRRLSRTRQAPKRYGFHVDNAELIIDDDPTSYKEAMFDIDFDKIA